jgi:radical SAM superfamily enzyme YgiQ (UPF0313 family)
MKNIYLFQPQYSVEIRNEDTYWLPYSVGCLWSYCNQFDEVKNNFVLKDIIFKREHPDKILERLDNPTVCSFSCYVWNEQYCLFLSKLIKEKFPDCIIQFGGPQTTLKILDNEFIDCVIIGEGEESYLDLLTSIIQNKTIEKIYQKSRIEQLDFPSPYESKVFDQIVKDNPNTLWASTIETNRGCPHSCTFCDWGGLTYSKVKMFNLDRVKNDLEWIKNNNVAFIFCADANFGMYKERDLEIAKLIREVADNSKLESVNLQYSKNSTEVVFEIAKILGDISRGVTISVQSMNEPTLKAIKRKNMSINNITSHIEKSKEHDVKTYTELILGLPNETIDSWKEGFSKILEFGQHESIDVWFCQVFGNSELNSELSRKIYGIETIKAEDYVSFTNEKDYSEVKESIELINKTDTLTTDELIECYMYGWLIVQLHIAGYTQVLSKYCFNILNISYRKFYDNLFDCIKNDDGFIGVHYQEIYNIVSTYIKTGKITQGAKTGHSLHASSFEFLFKNKSKLFEFIELYCSNIVQIDSEIIDIQKKFIFNENQKYPLTLNSKYNIETWEKNKISYKIDNDFIGYDKNNLFILRRKGLLKNKFIKIT